MTEFNGVVVVLVDVVVMVYLVEYCFKVRGLVGALDVVKVVCTLDVFWVEEVASMIPPSVFKLAIVDTKDVGSDPK